MGLSLPAPKHIIARRNDGQAHKYDVTRKVDADIHWMLAVRKEPTETEFIRRPLSIFMLDGVSAGQSWKAVRQILADKPLKVAPRYVLRYLAFKVLGWSLYDFMYYGKFKPIMEPDRSRAIEMMKN